MGKIQRVDYDARAFLMGVMGMSAFDIGVYWVICSLIYESEGPIDADDERIFKVIGSKKYLVQAAIDRLADGTVKAKLERIGAQLANRRAEIELVAASKRISNAQIAAETRWNKGGEFKGNNGVTDATAKNGAVLNHTIPNHTNQRRMRRGSADAPDGSTSPRASEAYQPIAPDAEFKIWIGRLEGWKKPKKFWMPDQWGPPPDKPGCKAPDGAMKAAGLTPNTTKG